MYSINDKESLVVNLSMAQVSCCVKEATGFILQILYFWINKTKTSTPYKYPAIDVFPAYDQTPDCRGEALRSRLFGCCTGMWSYDILGFILPRHTTVYFP